MLFNIADMRTVHSREAYDSLKEHVGDKLLDTVVRQSIAYAESSERAISILEHRPDLGEDYVRLADESSGAWGCGGAGARARAAQRLALEPAAIVARPALQSSRTSAPWGSNGTRMTSAQPSASRRRASTTPAVAS